MVRMAKKAKINKEYVQNYVKEHGYPEVGHFEVKEDLQKFYKYLTDEQLLEWIELEGLEFKPSESQPINRMRMCMAILYKHFPKAPSKKKKSKYADYTLEDLINMALQHEVPVEPTEDERIMRMRTIMALRAAGYLD
jgi:hypothetical protein